MKLIIRIMQHNLIVPLYSIEVSKDRLTVSLLTPSGEVLMEVRADDT